MVDSDSNSWRFIQSIRKYRLEYFACSKIIVEWKSDRKKREISDVLHLIADVNCEWIVNG